MQMSEQPTVVGLGIFGHEPGARARAPHFKLTLSPTLERQVNTICLRMDKLHFMSPDRI